MWNILTKDEIYWICSSKEKYKSPDEYLRNYRMK